MNISSFYNIATAIALKPSYRYIIVFFFLFISFPLIFFKVPQTSLDPSWQIAIHLALKFELIFGKDFVFTYGPLGILYTRLPIGVPKIIYLLFDLFFIFNLGFILNYAIKKSFGLLKFLFISLALITVTREGAEQWYFFFFLFHLLLFQIETNKIIHIALALVLSLICFYLKLSLGIISIAVFLSLIIFLLIRKELSWVKGAIILSSYLSIVWLSSYFLKVDLSGYIQNSYQIINAYNDAMLTPGEEVYHSYLWIVFSILLSYITYSLFLFFKSIKSKRLIEHLDDFLILFILGLFLFVIYKNGVVRYGSHIYMFFRGGVFVACLAYLFLPKRINQIHYAIHAWFIIIVSFWAINVLPESHKPYQNLVDLSIFKLKASEIKKYINDVKEYDKWISNSPKQNQKLIAIIKDRTIDIVPVEISQVYFNSLKYNPRPVIQSYSAYSGYLDSLNFKKYMSSSSPDFILYSLGTIDDRYGFFDETWTRLAMLSNYEPVGSFDNQIILSKSENPENLVRGRTEIAKFKLGEEIVLNPGNSLQLASVDIRYSFLGKLRRVFLKPPALTMTITLENGEAYTYKVITTILKGGVILNKYIDSNDELEIFMNSKGELNTNISKIRFDPVESSWGLVDSLKITITHFWVRDSTRSQMDPIDSARAIALFNKFKPYECTKYEHDRDSLRIWVDRVKTHSQLITISGWAFLEFNENDSSRVSVVLKSREKKYELPTVNYNRPDLPLFYNRSDVKNSAYNASVLKSALPAAIYQIGIHLRNKPLNIDAIYFTDKTVEVKNIATIQKIIKPDNIVSRIFGEVDSVLVDKNEIRICGWTTPTKRDISDETTNVLLESDNDVFRVSTNFVLDKDLPKEKNLFAVNLLTHKLPTGIYKVYIEKFNLKTNKSELILSNKLFALGVVLSITPKEITDMPADLGKVTKGIDQFTIEGDYLKISGWAVPPSTDFKEYKIEIILKSTTEIYRCETTSKRRPDVTAHFKNQYHLDDCGFEIIINTKGLPQGTYQVGLFLHQGDKKGKIDFLDQPFIKH
jgi:hypothetical protein